MILNFFLCGASFGMGVALGTVLGFGLANAIYDSFHGDS